MEGGERERQRKRQKKRERERERERETNTHVRETSIESVASYLHLHRGSYVPGLGIKPTT